MENIIILTTRNKKLFLQEEKAYELWENHYSEYLQRLWYVFKIECEERNLWEWSEISYPIFCKWVFDNSEKYLSPYV